MRNDSNRPILIAGAGIGGLTAAYALHQQGLPVEVFEQAEKPFLEADAGLCMWSNATTCLNKLGLRGQVRDVGVSIEKYQIWSASGLLFTESSIHRLSKLVGAPSIGVRQSDLMRILLNACHDIPIHFASRCVGYVQHEDGVMLRLEDGQEIPGQAIIAADGLHSVIRAKLIGDGVPVYTGHTIWSGISDGSRDLEKGTVFTVWGTHDLHAGCWHVDDSHIAWFIRIDAPAGGHDMPGTMKPHLSKLVKNIRGPFAHLVELTPETQISRTDLYASAHVAFLRLNPVALLGDAAHAMPNALGQGAGQTIEDGIVLAQSLAEAPDVMAGLALYEKRRLPRVKWVREQVYRFDRVQEAEHPHLLWVRNRASRLLAPDSSMKLWRELLTFPD
jgi:FAD-dependent urate hydroxylase